VNHIFNTSPIHSIRERVNGVFVPCVKSFGDFVIALNAVRRVRPQPTGSQPMVVAGQHLSPLASALGAVQDIHLIGDDTWTDTPAAFDVGKRGKVAAVRSLLELRRLLASLNDGQLMFDRLAWRERFIGGRHKLIGLPNDCDNIYLAYERGLVDLGYTVAATEFAPTRLAQKAVIIPGSRILRKTVPAKVIAAIHADLLSHGIQATVIALEGEAVEVPAAVPMVTLPRRFDALVAAVRATDIVISADSLSAHLGEYHGLPTFVATPTPNRYWLPRSCFVNGHWSSFSEVGTAGCRLHQFISLLTDPRLIPAS